MKGKQRASRGCYQIVAVAVIVSIRARAATVEKFNTRPSHQIETGAREVGARQVGAREVGACEIGVFEVGVREVGVREIGANK